MIENWDFFVAGVNDDDVTPVDDVLMYSFSLVMLLAAAVEDDEMDFELFVLCLLVLPRVFDNLEAFVAILLLDTFEWLAVDEDGVVTAAMEAADSQLLLLLLLLFT